MAIFAPSLLRYDVPFIVFWYTASGRGPPTSKNTPEMDDSLINIDCGVLNTGGGRGGCLVPDLMGPLSKLWLKPRNTGNWPALNKAARSNAIASVVLPCFKPK
jgi:hypothetical protein